MSYGFFFRAKFPAIVFRVNAGSLLWPFSDSELARIEADGRGPRITDVQTISVN
jgi:hypothetical protein